MRVPIYVYRCKKCGYQFELKQPFGSPPPDKCPSDGCDGEVVKVFTPPAIIFKGPGFHVTDYGRGSGNGKKRESSKSESETGGEKAKAKSSSSSDSE